MQDKSVDCDSAEGTAPTKDDVVKDSKAEVKEQSSTSEQAPKRQKVDKSVYNKVFGDDPDVDVILKLGELRTSRLKISDVQGLLLWALIEEANTPRWAFIKNRTCISKVVFVMVDSLSEGLLKENTKGFPKMALMSNRAVPIMNLSSSMFSRTSVLQFYLNCQKKVRAFESSKRKNDDSDKNNEKTTASNDSKKLKSNDGTAISTSEQNQNDTKEEKQMPPPSYYILSDAERKENNYIVSETDEEGADFFRVNERDEKPECHIIALDCEMVVTTEGLEVARITIVDWEGDTIYDELVKPKNRIVDYSTKWSGITKEILDPVNKTLEEVQDEIKLIIFKDTIIVGHSLENDLNVLKLIHENVIDTSILYPHKSGHPFKVALKGLTRRYLRRAIQTGIDGHDSAEDAIAALDLAKLKFKHGPSFGMNMMDKENIFSLLNRYQIKCAMVAQKSVLSKFAPPTVSAIISNSDSNVVQKMKSVLKGESRFVFGVLNGPSLSSKPTMEDCLKIDTNISNIFDHCPKKSLFVVVTGEGISHNAKRLQKLQMEALKAGNREKFTREMKRELDDAMSKSQNALGFISVKK